MEHLELEGNSKALQPPCTHWFQARFLGGKVPRDGRAQRGGAGSLTEEGSGRRGYGRRRP